MLDGRFPQFSPISEGSLLVTIGDGLSLEVNRQVRAVDALMQQEPIEGVREWVPCFATILVLYDPFQVQIPAIKTWVEGCYMAMNTALASPSKQVDLLVTYGGLDGPDLPDVAAFHGVSEKDVVEKHTGQIYQVGMMGFLPGFAYLLGVDPALATPRLKKPRTLVPAGSVGIAGEQTGVYPLDSPGGWRIIGRTTQVLFDPHNPPHFTLSPGDRVRFIPTKEGIFP